MLKHTNFELGPGARCRRDLPGSWAVAALMIAAGCSFQNYDELTNGAGTTAPSLGGATSTGGKSGLVGGTGATIGGTSGVAQGGTAQGGTQTTPLGGAIATGGAPTGGASPLPCPLYTGGAPGTVMAPPSNNFESSMSGWSTVSEHVTSLSLVQGATDACQGSSYLQCAGMARQANWDGPAFNVMPYLTAGHTYEASVAARFDPQNPPDAGFTSMKFSMALYCTDSSINTTYSQIAMGSTSTNWLRLTGPLATSVSGCPSLARLVVYVESDSTAAQSTIQIDDFQLIDTTTGSTGTGGATSTGAGGSGPVGGSPPIGGVTASGGAATAGGAPPGGGAPSTGGALGTGGDDASVTSDGGPDGG